MILFFYLYLLTCFTFLPQIVHSSESESPLIVKLTTEQQQQPFYLIKFMNEDSGFSDLYLEKLEKVLQFDLENSGYIQLLPQTADRQNLALSKNLKTPGIAKDWRLLNALFVLKVQIKQKKIQATVLSVGNQQTKTFEGFNLTGELNQDRQQMHLLSDALMRSLFQVTGVASSHILFTRKYPITTLNQWQSELWECDYDGANARKVLNNENGYCITPVYVSPTAGKQASMFLYVSYRDGQPKIYLASLENGAGQKLTPMRGNQLMPAISANRDKIAFISDITGNPDLFLQDFSPEKGPLDKPRQIFATHQATQGSPTFSPDGKQIAFVSNKDGAPRIYVLSIPPKGMHMKDIKARLITRVNRESTAPNWSPDGTKLAYSARNGDLRQIWIYDFEKDEESQLTKGDMHKENPSWAPDSMHLVYNTTAGNGVSDAELYMINLNHPNPVKISPEFFGEKRFPAWERK